MADEIADTFDRLAIVHEEIARMTGSTEASSRAVLERSVAVREREAAQWFRSIESGN